MKKRSNAIDSEQSPQGGGDMQFRRWEYWGFSGLFILHYTGDHTVFSAILGLHTGILGKNQDHSYAYDQLRT